MTSPSERLAILDRLEKGEINPEEAARLLSATGQTQELAAHGEADSPMSVLGRLERGEINADEAARRLESAKRPTQSKQSLNGASRVSVRNIANEANISSRSSWWLPPLIVGVVMTALSGLWLRADASDGILGFWFYFALLPLFAGIALIVTGALLRRSHWVRVRVKGKDHGHDVNVNTQLPIPFDLASGLMDKLGLNIRGFNAGTVEQIKVALKKASADGQPVHIQANGDDGAVDIYIN
jgi:polyhydroxyalkanoate synthesis regulator phasin